MIYLLADFFLFNIERGTCFKYIFMNLIFLPFFFLSPLIVLSLSVTVKVLVTFVEVLS